MVVQEILPIFDFEAPLKGPGELRKFQEMVPLLRSISRSARKKIAGLNAQLAFFKGQTTKCRKIQRKINHELQKWSEKMRKLGLTPIAIWKVQADTVDGIYSWEFPQEEFVPYKEERPTTHPVGHQ